MLMIVLHISAYTVGLSARRKEVVRELAYLLCPVLPLCLVCQLGCHPSSQVLYAYLGVVVLVIIPSKVKPILHLDCVRQSHDRSAEVNELFGKGAAEQ